VRLVRGGVRPHQSDQKTALSRIRTANYGRTVRLKAPFIDTSQVPTDTIDYVATDTWGNAAANTLTVIVDAATSSVQ